MRYFLIPFSYYNPYERLGFNQILLEKVQKDTVFISFTGWDTTCVSIGTHQKIHDVIDMVKVRKKKLPILRRESGGGAVILTPKDICWGIVAPSSYFPLRKNDIYEFACNKVILALKKMNIQSEFKPINDVRTQNGKISGSAIIEKNGVTYVMGTLLYDVDTQLMRDILQPQNDRKKSAPESEKKLTCICNESSVSFEDTIKIITETFCENHNINIYRWTPDEKKRAKIFAQHFQKSDWIYRL